MKYLLDINVLTDFARGERDVMARLPQETPDRCDPEFLRHGHRDTSA